MGKEKCAGPGWAVWFFGGVNVTQGCAHGGICPKRGPVVCINIICACCCPAQCYRVSHHAVKTLSASCWPVSNFILEREPHFILYTCTVCEFLYV